MRCLSNYSLLYLSRTDWSLITQLILSLPPPEVLYLLFPRYHCLLYAANSLNALGLILSGPTSLKNIEELHLELEIFSTNFFTDVSPLVQKTVLLSS